MNIARAVTPVFAWVAAGVLCSRQATGDSFAYNEVKEVRTDGRTMSCTHRHDGTQMMLEARFEMAAGAQDPLAASSTLACVQKATGKVLFKTRTPALTVVWISDDERFIVGLSNIKYYNPYQLVVYGIDGELIHRAHVTDVEACFDERSFRNFVRDHAAVRTPLLSRAVVAHGKVYVDYTFLNASRIFGSSVWDELHKRMCVSHFPADIEESVTNSVRWYDEDDPGITLIRASDGKPTGLTLRDRRGRSVTVSFAPHSPMVDRGD